jgi:hypothetical protein
MLMAAAGLTGCGTAACPAVGYVGGVTLHLTPERARTLSALQVELCQDGTCTTRELLPDPAASASASSPATQAVVPTRVPVAEHRPDGGIDFRLWDGSLTDHPLDVTVTGRDVQGTPIATSRAQLQPVTAYPHGRQCGGPTTAVATLDDAGLHAG